MIKSLTTEDCPATIEITLLYFGLVCSMEKAVAPHSSTLAWKIPWAEETGRLRSIGSLRVRHD